jgi:hypothetical protein
MVAASSLGKTVNRKLIDDAEKLSARKRKVDELEGN